MKRQLKKLIPAIIVFLIGMSAVIIGALFKILQWPYGEYLLIAGSIFEVIGIIMFIMALIQIYRSKN